MSLRDRIRLLDDAARRGERVVVCIAQDKKAAQFRYRCENIVESTLKSKKWQTVWFLNSEISEILNRTNKIELVIIVRQAAKDNRILEFINEVKKLNIRVLFDLDDLIFDVPGVITLMKTIGSCNPIGWFGYMWGVRRIARVVDGFVATNEFLADRLRKSFKKPVVVIRNSLNKEQVDISRKFLKQKTYNDFVVGYFSGSPTHVKDFRLVEPELIKFLKMYDKAKLRVIGYMDFSDDMKKWIKLGRVESFGPVNYLDLQRFIADVNVNIAPLLVNEFTNCKSELKFFEAAVVETTTIASPTYAFKKAIENGKTGFLAQTGEWYEKLEYLYKHSEENKIIAKAAERYALKNYYGKEFLQEIERAYEFFAE